MLERGDRTFVLVDTAGLRRKRRHRQGIEYYSELRALEAAERADVALVLIDASEGDRRAGPRRRRRRAQGRLLDARSSSRSGTSTTIDVEDVRGQLRRRLRQRPPFIAISAQTGRGLERLLDGIAELFDRHVARIPTPELNRALAELREARQPPSGSAAGGSTCSTARRSASARRASASSSTIPASSRATTATGSRTAARALRPRGRAGLDRLRETILTMRFLVVGAGSWGTAFTRVLLERGHDVVLACHTREQAEAIASTGLEPALPAERRPARGRGGCARRRARPTSTSSSSRCRASAFADVVAALPGRRAGAQPRRRGSTRRPASGSRRASRGRSVAVLSGPNMAEEIAVGLPTAAVIASEDGYPRGPAPARAQLDRLPRVRQPRRRRRRAVRGGEERDRARGRRRRRARLGDNAKASLITRGLAEMTRLGEAAGARPETFAGLAGMGDLIVSCWSSQDPQPPRGRADRAGADAGARRSPRSARRSRG